MDILQGAVHAGRLGQYGPPCREEIRDFKPPASATPDLIADRNSWTFLCLFPKDARETMLIVRLKKVMVTSTGVDGPAA